MADRHPRTSIAVCALTLNRPKGLEAMLAGLAALESPGPGVDVSVIIVDNDPAGGSRAIVEAWNDRMPWRLTFDVESQRGIPFGRNRAVRLAGPVDFVAFLDDDEVPDRRWLAELLSVQRQTGADVVTGTVLPRFEAEPERWVRAGRFFDRPRYPTGTQLTYARTSDVLIAAHVFPAADDRPFNERMGLNGGDDTHFFMRARLAGYRIVWADDAVVIEDVPISRVSERWILRREYRRGNTLSLCLRDLSDSRRHRVRRVGSGLWQIGSGIALVFPGLRHGRRGLVSAAKRVAFGAGLLSGLAGLRFDEYKEIHGQ